MRKRLVHSHVHTLSLRYLDLESVVRACNYLSSALQDLEELSRVTKAPLDIATYCVRDGLGIISPGIGIASHDVWPGLHL